ncbi:MAG: O-antigen ligase family protein [Ancrocorticia sp.]|uniref:O-antigen ligase family protein n=1 Tax=Ancrocorticia sp. TaxID=2593684 RepID=UPI003F924F2C
MSSYTPWLDNLMRTDGNAISKQARGKHRAAMPRTPLFAGMVMLYAFMTSFDFVEVVPGISVGRLAALLLIFVAILSLREASLVIDPLVATIYLLAIVSTLTVAVNPGHSEGLTSYLSLILNLLIVGLVCLFPCTQADRRRWQLAMVSGGLVLTGLMFVSPVPVADVGPERIVVGIAGSQQDPNEFCGYLIVATAFFTYRLLAHASVLSLIPLGVMLYAALLTGSRGGLLALLVTIVVSIVVAVRASERRWGYSLAAVGLGSLMILGFNRLLEVLPDGVAGRFQDFSASGTAGQRTRAWSDVLGAYWNDSSLVQLLVGHGFGATTDVTFNGLVAHNLFIELLYSTGLLGLTCFLALLGIGLRRLWRGGAWISVASLAGFCVFFMTLSALAFKPFWVILMLAAGYRAFGHRAPRMRHAE